MTMRPSDAPWADGPFPLIATPSKRSDLSIWLTGSSHNPDHFHVRAATGMAHAHNGIIRGLNAIILQAPNVPSKNDERYRPKDVKDLLSFVRSWIKMVNHHHAVEETYIFPEMAKFSGGTSLFQDGMDRLLACVTATRPHEYRWAGGMKEVVDSFSKHLTVHLYAEIDVFLGFGYLDSEDFRQRLGMLSDVFPCVYGCSDRTYEGGNLFPMLHWTIPYLIKYYFAVGKGAWRFNPSDWWCKPRPLLFVLRAEVEG
ncbi:hypothetical protein F4808DRAFT_454230 [Astrocystis sublimbata]|nr:hypothetical protein F4808DRAFT_454230 [Astrocystis sublimbata]